MPCTAILRDIVRAGNYIDYDYYIPCCEATEAIVRYSGNIINRATMAPRHFPDGELGPFPTQIQQSLSENRVLESIPPHLQERKPTTNTQTI